MTHSGLLYQLGTHEPTDSEEAADLRQIREFVARHARPFDRSILEGHLTGSAVVVAPDGSGVLLLENDYFRVTKWTGSPAPSADTIPIEGSFGGMAVRSGEPTVVNDTSTYDLSGDGDPRPRSLLANSALRTFRATRRPRRQPRRRIPTVLTRPLITRSNQGLRRGLMTG